MPVVLFPSSSECFSSNLEDFSQESSLFNTSSHIDDTSSIYFESSFETSSFEDRSEIVTSMVETSESSIELEPSTTISMEQTSSEIVSSIETTTAPRSSEQASTTSTPSKEQTVSTSSSSQPTTTERFVDSSSDAQTWEESVDSSSEAQTSQTPSSSSESSSTLEEESTTAPTENVAIVTHSVKVANAGKTFTGLPTLPEISQTVTDPSNLRGLSTARRSFSFGVASDGKPNQITVNNQQTFDSYHYNALAWDNKTSGKVLYLTFDCGYVYKDLVSQILDTLEEKNVPAAFFCTLDYLEDAPSDVTRMIQEGHIVGNHTTTHPSYSSALSRSDIAWEILGVHNYLRVNFGYDCKFFRFPEGAYSVNALELVDSIGYHSVFWSIAHTDWDPNNQPGVDVSFETVTSRLHPGAVILLHATSPDNAEILGDFIDYAIAQGYEFRSLEQYAYWTD